MNNLYIHSRTHIFSLYNILSIQRMSCLPFAGCYSGRVCKDCIWFRNLLKTKSLQRLFLWQPGSILLVYNRWYIDSQIHIFCHPQYNTPFLLSCSPEKIHMDLQKQAISQFCTAYSRFRFYITIFSYLNILIVLNCP